MSTYNHKSGAGKRRAEKEGKERLKKVEGDLGHIVIRDIKGIFKDILVYSQTQIKIDLHNIKI